MQPEKETYVKAGEPGGDTGAAGAPVACPSCRAPLVHGMRFCRQCGYRLGEGVEEYAETRRFSGDIPYAPAGTSTRQAGGNRTFTPGEWAPLAAAGSRSSTLVGAGDKTTGSKLSCALRRMAGNWVLWVVLIVVAMTAAGVVIRNVRRGVTGDVRAVSAPVSFLGVDGFETADGGGAFIEGIAAPDAPVERAGLLGGDVITSFDGKTVNDESEMRRILRATPPGKTVEVVFTRDGEVKTTQLTTIAERDFRGMAAVESRPEGKGYLGLSEIDRVAVPGTNIHGVRIEVRQNRPADTAGLRNGDIIVEFNGKPIRTEGDLRLRIAEAIPGSTVKAVVVRGAERVEIPVKLGRD